MLKRVLVDGEYHVADLVTMGSGDMFGEVAIMQANGKRTASVVAWGPSVEVLELSRLDFLERFDKEILELYHRKKKGAC